MIKFVFYLILLSFTISTLSADNATINERLKQPVKVVLSDGDEPLNAAIKSAIENNWTISDYAFITHEQFKEDKKVSDNIYLMLLENESIDGSSNPYDHVLQAFYMVRSGSFRNNITGVPLSSVTSEGIQKIISNAVLLLQDKLSFEMAKEINKEYTNFDEQVKSKTGIVKTKKLYVIQQDLDQSMASLDQIKEVYSGEVFIVSEQELQKIIQSKTDAAYITVDNVKSGMNYFSYKNIIDASNGKVLYTNESKGKNETAFGKADFEKLMK